MDLNWLQDIVCLENTQSFTQAARRRNITQSAFSRRVKALEEWIGTPLIDRTSYPVRLTSAGKQFSPLARRLLFELEEAREHLREIDRSYDRVFRIAAPHSIASNFLAPRLAQLYLYNRKLKARVFSDNAAACFDLLSQGVCEFLVNYRYPPFPVNLDETRFIGAEIGTEWLVPVADQRAINRTGWQFPGAPDAPLPMLAYDQTSFLGSVVAHFLGSRQERLYLNIRHTDAFAEAIKAMCKEGTGIAWLPQSLVTEDLETGRLVRMGGPDWSIELTYTLFAQNQAEDDAEQTLRKALCNPGPSIAAER
jgi:DNA-binding transcriptional LysR family regulator